jgi:LmbE family N-acetylglucosaminyl deacetylase
MPAPDTKSALAIFAHPDDIEFVAAGTLLQLGLRGWELHYLNLCSGNCGSVHMDARTTAEIRLKEAQAAARILGAKFHPPMADDLELFYGPETLKKVAAIVREVRPRIVLTHSSQDYMEDHMNTSRLAVTAAFAHGIPNFQTEPPRASFSEDVTVYHAMPHGLSDPLRQKVRAGLYVNTTAVHECKRAALAAHTSQRDWLDVSQGMDSYLSSMDDLSRLVGGLSGRFEHAEGWRRHLHLGFSSKDIDPLNAALEADCAIDASYESALLIPR